MANGQALNLIAAPGQPAAPPPLVTPPVSPYDPSEDRERKRGQIALALVGLLAGIASVSLVFVMFAASKERQDALKGVVELVFGPIVGLVGAVTGFYFGAKSKE